MSDAMIRILIADDQALVRGGFGLILTRPVFAHWADDTSPDTATTTVDRVLGQMQPAGPVGPIEGP